MSVTDVLHALGQDPHQKSHWEALGTFLREEHFRTSSAVTDSLPLILSSSAANLEQYLELKHHEQVPLILEVTRCIVNLLADSDDNRLFFQGASEQVPRFWTQIQNCLKDPLVDTCINRRVMIILGQFVHSETYKQQYLQWIFDHHFLSPLHIYLKHNLPACEITEVFKFQNAFDFLKELVDVNATTIASNPGEHGPVALNLVDYLITTADTIVHSLDKFNLIEEDEEGDDDEESDLFDLDEIVLNIAGTVSYLTTFEDLDFSPVNANQRVLKLISLVPASFPNKTHTKRKLFSTSGCISSMKSFANRDDIQASVEYFTQSEVDPYVLAASAINLGNYITDKSRLSEVGATIEAALPLEAFFRSFFNMRVNDVIQIQSLHLLNNLVTASTTSYVLANYDHFFGRFAKIIVDNGKYYQDVYQIFQKFVNKVIRLAFIGNLDNILDYQGLWDYIIAGADNSDDTQYLLLQAYISVYKDSSITTANTPANAQFLTKLIRTAVSVPRGASPLGGFLEKLKTLGMLFHNLTSHNIRPADLIEYLYRDSPTLQAEIADPYHAFLVQLKEQVLQAPDQHHDILINNSKFVCITSVTFWDGYAGAENIVSVCKEIASS